MSSFEDMAYRSAIAFFDPHRTRALALPALGGCAYALVSLRTPAPPFAWLGLAVLAFALEGRRRQEPGARAWFEGGARGLAFGAAASLVAQRFVPAVIARFTPLPYVAGVLALVLLALAQGLPWAIAAMVRSALVRARVPSPVAFASGVYVGTLVPQIFPWTPAGGVAPWAVMVQLADLVGERGVSALLALTGGLLGWAVQAWREGGSRRRIAAALAGATALPVALAWFGAWRIRMVEGERAHAPVAAVGLVDGLVPATTRWDSRAAPGIVQSLAALTAGAERRGAELTVWPEAAYPYVLPRASRAAPRGNEGLPPRDVRGPLLVGAVTKDGAGEQTNAALVVLPERVLGAEYDKLHLLWFGESVPLASELPWLRRAFARGVGMVPGTGQVPLVVGDIRAAALICFEDTLPEAGREAAQVSPNLLVNLSNDAWFDGSAEPELHLRVSVLRAVEARRDLVRAVNFGPASWVDAAGRVRARYDPQVPGTLLARPALLDGPPTPYARFGDLPVFALQGLIAVAYALLRKRSAQNGTSAGPLG
ncbi:MAG TPA: apolipoprotein N-acyltransferase [Polyangiaceae bacterium]